MKKFIAFALLFVAVFAYMGKPGPGPGYEAMVGSGDVVPAAQMEAIANMPATALSEQEASDILWMREEEKLARDVYLTLYDKWGLSIFRNIARSEQNHMDAVKALIEKYNFSDPVEETGDERGVFKNPELQSLYSSLVEQGSKSLVDALKVGAEIEELDIKDLQDRIARTDNEDVKLVYENLMRGSRNHLRAFVSQIERNGAEYEPKHINREEYEKIVGSEWERGTEKTGITYGKNEVKNRQGRAMTEARGRKIAIMRIQDIAGRIGNPQARQRFAEIVKELNSSEEKIEMAEERIRRRSGLMRFLFGGDYRAAEQIEQEVERIQNRIQEMRQIMKSADNETRAMLEEQIMQMEQEMNRLREIAEREKRNRGIFGWLFRI